MGAGCGGGAARAVVVGGAVAFACYDSQASHAGAGERACRALPSAFTLITHYSLDGSNPFILAL